MGRAWNMASGAIRGTSNKGYMGVANPLLKIRKYPKVRTRLKTHMPWTIPQPDQNENLVPIFRRHFQELVLAN